MAKKKTKKKSLVCIYCRTRTADTIDHVPPKNLYVGSGCHSQKVPACNACNKGFSDDEEYFRNMLAIDASMQNYGNKEFFNTIFRSLSNPHKRAFTRNLLSKTKMVDVVTPSGVWIEKKIAHEINCDRLNRVASKIVYGLYYLQRKQTLPNNYGADAILMDVNMPESEKSNLAGIADIMKKNGVHYIGTPKVFKYLFEDVQDDPFTTIWLLIFYERFLFLGCTNTKDTLQEFKKLMMGRRIIYPCRH